MVKEMGLWSQPFNSFYSNLEAIGAKRSPYSLYLGQPISYSEW